jgi:mannose-6-phosphate isomerase-like protein (cupin superfamily)
MDVRFDELFEEPENEIFRIVFFPDRIYHARYLSATRSSRYRYAVSEVRSNSKVTAMKGTVFFGGEPLCSMLRLEYSAQRLLELARERGRSLGPTLRGWVRLQPAEGAPAVESNIVLHFDAIAGAYAVELWETLEPPEGATHDYRVLPLMGRDAPITRAAALLPALKDVKTTLRKVEFAVREDDRQYPTSRPTDGPQWDNNFARSHQEPRTQEPSAGENTVEDRNYLLDFQRGFFFPDAHAIAPVRYRNAMLDDGDPDRRDDNVIEMRWVVQRELGSDVVFFHEVTIPPGTIEGTHRHIGSEELYYIVAGEGVAYMQDGDDPANDQYPLVTRPIYGLDPRPCREIPVKPGSVIYTKSGGVHGIRNPGTEPLRFVAFLYQGA